MRKILFGIVMAVAAMSANAQALKVATGSSSGTYSKVVKEFIAACANDGSVAEVNTKGSMENIDLIVGNTVSAAFVQTDVLHFRARTEDLSNVKTLVTLFPEQVHIVTLAVPKIKEGGFAGVGAKQVTFNTLSDLNGRMVVAGGGSFITAQVIRLQTEIAFQVAEVPDTKTALDAVASGQAAAAIVVGGAPMDSIKALDKNFKLLSINEADIGKLKNVYKPAVLNYSGMGAAGVKTVSTDAVWVARNYKTPKFVDGLTKLRTCFNAKAPELAEQPGFHVAWSKIEVGAEAKWPMWAPSKK